MLSLYYMKKKITILGSTGSIGTQALEVIEQHPDHFEAYALTAGHNADLLIQQARKFQPEFVVIADESEYEHVREALADLPLKVYAGAEALCAVASLDCIDIVLTAMVGFAGLKPTIAAIKAHKTIALANKETLVVAGALITPLCLEHKAPIIPVDSEHSAIFQCLMGARENEVEKLIITASGGPFRTFTAEQMQAATPQQALNHPNWHMGAKITIDSATMMNKGFEVTEARWLFDVTPDRIQVVVHPQSVIHSMVQFVDGAVMAQLGTPDMRLPIQLAFSYPQRLKSDNGRLSFEEYNTLTFETPDENRFPCLRLAYEALKRGGTASCLINAANEVANQAFRNGQIPFCAIPEIIEHTLNSCSFVASPSLDDYFNSDNEARSMASELLKKY